MQSSPLPRDAFMALRRTVLAVPVPDAVVEVAVDLSARTRPNSETATETVTKYVAFGAGPRGSQNLVLAAKARALLEGRTTPIVADIHAVALPILRHRIILNHRAIGDGFGIESLVESILSV